MKPLGAASSSPGGPAAAGAASAARYADDIGLAISLKKGLDIPVGFHSRPLGGVGFRTNMEAGLG